MSFLSRLFKSKNQRQANPKLAAKTNIKATQAASLEEQLRTLEQQSPAQLLLLINGDHNEQVRDAAIQKLNYGAELVELAKTNLSARKKIGQLLEQQHLTVEQLTLDVPNQLELINLLSYSPKATLEIIAAIDDSALLLQLACEGTTTQLRQAAATRIEERTELEQLCKVAQSKDKTVYKIAKTKLDSFKASDAERAEAQSKLAIICEKLEKLAHLNADPMFKAKLELLESEWQTMAESASAALRERYQRVLRVCQQQLVDRAEEIAQAEESLALDQQATAFVHTALAEAQQLILTVYGLPELTSEQANTYRQQLSDLTQAVRLAVNRNLPLGKVVQEFEQAHQHANNLLESMVQHGTLAQLSETLATNSPKATEHTQTILNQLLAKASEFYHNNLPNVLDTPAQTLKAWRTQQANAKRQEKAKLGAISELIRKGLWAAQQGMVRKARGVYKELQEKHGDLSSLPAGIQGKLDELNAALARLSDWHEFAVTPKKEALLEQMLGLVDSSLSPSDLATKIHELQDEWKSLSRGIQQADEELWEQFHQASQVAFAPCKEFFEAQGRERELNLSKRQLLISQLETYLNAYDWDNAIWSDVEKTLKVARQEWQTYWPVPRKAAEELQTTFDGLMDIIHQKLKSFYQQNKAAKLALIEQAQTCVSAEQLPQAIEQIKSLQQQWKTIGKSYPKEDQHLWHEFRKHCDAVFARRAQVTAELNEARAAQIEQAEAIINTLRGYLALPAQELIASQHLIAEQQTAFNAIDLAREPAKALQASLKQTVSEITSKINAERNQAEIRRWQDLFLLSNQLRQLELAVLADSQEVNALADACSQQLDAPPALPNGSLVLLTERLSQAKQVTRELQLQNLHNLRILCLRAEIISNKESPESERNLRMNYLMQQLQQGLGKRDDSLEALVFEWISLGAIADSDYQSLEQRLLECLSSNN